MKDEQPAAEESTESTATPPVAEKMTPQQLEEAKRYGRTQLFCDLLDKGIDFAFLAAMAFLIAAPLDGFLIRYFPSAVPRLVLLYLVMMGLHEAASFPLACYAGYTVEHRFGLSRQTFRGWLWRHAKQYALALVLGLVIYLGLFGLMWGIGSFWWLVAAMCFFVVSVVLGQLAPVLLLPLFYKIDRLEDPELIDRMAGLAEGTGLSIEGVYRMGMSEETSKANAMLAGLGRTRRVLMGDTLLEKFNPDEIEVIFAHEIGHHVFRHIHKMIVAGLIYATLGLWACDRMLALWIGPGYDAADMPVRALPMIAFLLWVMSTLLEPLQNFISRRYERQCDRYALRRTGRREAFISAFNKLAVLNKDDPEPHPLEVALFHSHPPISERLALADE